ncbi:DUF3817 domain-containing protein [Corynebacterium lizhenjunii]|uniref:DUF3817 domain-containing protein n=1 Tax=Corynebacterium lizhenjunii TaxID=2709394 RepID=A0A7T0KDY4_9CORY|nr:DUF3817 domain-containing protein [Corynebacterium lizhenjunii]QPK78832.1 DUF3817 domain-containing protein [Corynebacterium lizhenjunii]
MNTPTPATHHPQRQARVSTALNIFSVLAWVTGVFLIALVIRMVCQYLLNMDIPAWATWIAIAHGWVYMAYVVSVLNLGMKALWPFSRMILTALAGVVPFFSFVMEAKRRRQVKAEFGL